VFDEMKSSTNTLFQISKNDEQNSYCFGKNVCFFFYLKDHKEELNTCNQEVAQSIGEIASSAEKQTTNIMVIMKKSVNW
jgi:hypothetical protein